MIRTLLASGLVGMVFSGLAGTRPPSVGLTANDLRLTGETARQARVGMTPSTMVATPPRKTSVVHERIVRDYAAAPEHPVVLFGDSLTDNWKGKRFAAMREEFAAVNAGLCGDRISDLLWRIEDMLPALKAKPPRVATFLIGTNDITMKSNAEEIAAGMRHLVEVLRAACPETKIVLFAIPPRAVAHDPRPLPFIAPINGLYREIADDRSVFFFDFSCLLTDRHGAAVLSEYYEGDRLHFSDKGYAEVVTPFVAGAIRLVSSPKTPADFTRRLALWRDYLELRRATALANQALEELWKNEWFLYELPQSLLKEFAAMKGDPDYIPQLPEECLRQGSQEGLPEALRTTAKVKSFPGLSPQDSRDGLANPERGWRFEVGVGRLTEDPCKFTHVTDQWPFPRFKKDGVTVTQAYCYLTQFHDREISQEKIAALEADFARARKEGVKFLLRFAYDHKPYLKPTPTLERLLAHIAQLKPVVCRNVDVIYCLQTGWVGAWGEFHSSVSGLEKDPKAVAAIMQATLDMLPPERMTMMRRMDYKVNALRSLGVGTNEVTAATAWTDTPAARIGFFNDGTLANWWDGGTFVDEPYADDSNWEYERVKREGLYTPVDGELFWSTQGEAHPCYACGMRAIDRFSQQHYTTFSLVHGHSLLNSGGVPWTIDGWKVTPVTPDELRFFKIDFDPAYFQGVPYRTAYEFIRDHLGYRLALKAAELPVAAGRARLTLHNYGFAAPVNPREVILVAVAPDGKVREIPTGFDCRKAMPGHDVKVAVEVTRQPGERFALWLPDPQKRLRLRPEYAVRLATRLTTKTIGGRLLHFVD